MVTQEDKMKNIFNNKRKSLFILFVAITVILYFFMNNKYKEQPKKQIDLETIGFEAKKLGASQSHRYMQFPSENREDVLSYFNSLPKLHFKPYVFEKVPEGWGLIGATLIHYGKNNLSVSFYKNNRGEKVYLFTMEDNGDFSQNNLLQKDSTNYSIYASEDINMILWKTNKRALNILAGWQSAKALIEFL